MFNIFSLIAQPESSGGINLYNPVSTSSGNAQGWYGITTGTWQDFAPQAGVDLSLYPTPNAAPQSVQQQVASVIPFGRWAASTRNYVAQQLGFIPASNQTLGQIQTGLDANTAADGSYTGGLAAYTPASLSTGAGGDYVADTPTDSSGGSGTVVPDPNAVPFIPDSANPLDPFNTTGTQNSPNAFLIPGTDTPLADQSGAYSGTFQFLDSSPFTLGGAQSTANVPVAPGSSGLGGIFATISDFAVRAGLVLLGIIMIAIGGFAAVRGEGIGGGAVATVGAVKAIT
jgi:hypothetical protein